MRLNQVIAVEKGKKAKIQADLDTLYKAVQKPPLFEGFNKTYLKKTEQEEDQPPQTVRVQLTGASVLTAFRERLAELFDITAQKDWANCGAKADVVVAGQVLVKDVPATYLLFLSKQLTDLFTVVSKIPTLDPAEDWHFEEATGLHKTNPTQTNRTKKVQKALVLYQASDKHPAQTQLITDDEVVGTWNQVKASGALTEARRKQVLSRIEELATSVKKAREEANLVGAAEVPVGAKLLGWVLA